MNFADPRILCAQGEFNDVDLLENITNKMLPLIQILPYISPSMSFLYFDLMEFVVEGDSRELQLTIKGIDTAVKSMMTNDCCGFQWYEQKEGIRRAKIDSTNTPAQTNIKVADFDQLEGITIGTPISVTIKANHNLVWIATVTSITPSGGNTATLGLNRTTPANIDDNDEVFRGSKIKKSCDAVDNTFGHDKTYIQTSYFQDVHGSMEVEVCELNQERRIATMKGMESGIYLMNHKVKDLFKGLIQTLSWALLLGADEPETTAHGSQMAGLMTRMQKAQIDCDLALIQLIDCCGSNVGDTFQDDKDTVAHLVEFFLARIKSSMYGSEPITFLLNQAGYQEIIKLRPAFETYFNAPNVLLAHDNTTYEAIRDYKNIKAMSIAFEGGNYVDFVQFPAFDAITGDEPMGIALPRHLISFVQKMVEGLSKDARPILSKEGSIPYFRFRKVETLQDQNWKENCRKFVTGIDIGQMIVGTEHGGYGAVIGFKSCNIPECETTQRDIVNFIADDCEINL